MLAAALLASAFASAAARPAPAGYGSLARAVTPREPGADAVARGRSLAVAAAPQKPITCAGSSSLSALARIGPGQLLLLSCGDGRRFLQVRVQGRPLAAMPVRELWPGADWELRDSPRVPVRSRTQSFVPLLLAQKSPPLERVVVVAADFENNTLAVAFAGPPAASVTYALRDLDGDGVPELRLGLDDGKRREVRTVSLGKPAAEWHGALAGPLGAAAKPLCAASGATEIECDPVLDFDVEARRLPDAVYLFARGRDRLCGSGGCALVVVRVAKGEGREVLRDFGLWTIGAAIRGRPPCVVIRNRAAPPQKRCWHGKDYGE